MKKERASYDGRSFCFASADCTTEAQLSVVKLGWQKPCHGGGPYFGDIKPPFVMQSTEESSSYIHPRYDSLNLFAGIALLRLYPFHRWKDGGRRCGCANDAVRDK